MMMASLTVLYILLIGLCVVSVQGLSLRLKGENITETVNITDLPVGGCRSYETLEALSDVKYRGRVEKAYWKYNDTDTNESYIVDDFRCSKDRCKCNSPDIGWWSIKAVYRSGSEYYGVLRLGRTSPEAKSGLFTCVYEDDTDHETQLYISLSLWLKGKTPISLNETLNINDIPEDGECRRYDSLEARSDVNFKYQGRMNIKAYWMYTDPNTTKEYMVDDIRCNVHGKCNSPDIGWWSARGIYRKGSEYYGALRLGKVPDKENKAGNFTCYYERDSLSPITVNIDVPLPTSPPTPSPDTTSPVVPLVSKTPFPTLSPSIPPVPETPTPSPSPDPPTPSDTLFPYPETITEPVLPSPSPTASYDPVDPTPQESP